MSNYIVIFIVLIIIVIGVLFNLNIYDDRGFNKKGFHKNGTRFDNNGYDSNGYDRAGYNRHGYNIHGYNKFGFDSKRRYNRYYDRNKYETQIYSSEGFLSPEIYPVALTDHARLRMSERLGITNYRVMDALAFEAYCFGKSTKQMTKSQAFPYICREENHDDGIILVWKNFVYIFSSENVLITLYKDERYRN